MNKVLIELIQFFLNFFPACLSTMSWGGRCRWRKDDLQGLGRSQKRQTSHNCRVYLWRDRGLQYDLAGDLRTVVCQDTLGRMFGKHLQCFNTPQLQRINTTGELVAHDIDMRVAQQLHTLSLME